MAKKISVRIRSTSRITNSGRIKTQTTISNGKSTKTITKTIKHDPCFARYICTGRFLSLDKRCERISYLSFNVSTDKYRWGHVRPA